MSQNTTLTMSTYAEQFNQFTPTQFNNPLFGNLSVLIDQNKQCWFIGVEVARMLGYASPRDTLRGMDQQYKIVVNLNEFVGNLPTNSPSRGNPNTTLISEQGMLSLIMRSNLPNIQQFQDWVYNVIVSIRQYGTYMSPQLKTVLEIDEEQAYKAAQQRIIEQQKQINQLQQQNQQYHSQINRLNQQVQGQQQYLNTQQGIVHDYRDSIKNSIDHMHNELNKLEYEIDHHRANYKSNLDYITDNIDQF